MNFKSLLLIASLFPVFSAEAQTEDAALGKRPVMSVYNLESGSARGLSTYLSPLYYSGWDFALSASWTKDFNHWPDKCSMRFEASVDCQDTSNPAKNASMYNLTGHFGWGLSWHKDFAPGWRATAGPMLDIYGGAMYSERNGNNPVNALAYTGLDIAASLRWRTHIGRLPVEVADEMRIPSAGAFFNPGYGESYYEIYLGNHRRLAHFGWWGNSWGINNLIAFRMNFGRTGMQIGYRFDLRTFKANNLETQLMRNCLVIGVIPHGW